ncbi:molybdate ABC transporter permease subunit [Fictibacillus aquaticus]|uniref:Molybdenum transport system permease n=1 Tax=Fictibacillus aquaticus TaxID=2021314 RepID=A0A235F4K1_9BACL|nr:molybdate ABC transporter permease subunit [Fictibacillus aquaticus]OYD56191.1 molybdate ABC transporter permease subunit [Fictibacillus aquaticus]
MNEEFWFPVQLSLSVSCIAAVIVFAAGTTLGKLFAAKKFKCKMLLETLLLMPLVLPPSVIGFLLIVMFGNNSAPGRFIQELFGHTLLFTPWAAVIAASVVAFPLMFQSAKAGFLSIDKDLEGAAKVDGASNWRVFISISVPLAARALVAGVILSFTRALGEFGATLMFAGNLPGKTQTIPTAIYVAIESGDTKLALNYVLISIAIAFIMLSLITYFNRQHD